MRLEEERQSQTPEEPTLAPVSPRRPIAPAGPAKRPRRSPRGFSAVPELSKGLKISLFLHGLLSVGFLVNTLVEHLDPEAQVARLKAREVRNAIRVDVVDLPSLKPEQLAMVDPTVEPTKNGSQESKPPEASPDAMVEPKDAKPAKPDPKVAKKDAKVPDKPGVQDVRERLRAEQKRQELMAKLKGEASTGGGGRPLLAGNKISEGYSVTGDVAKDQDIYVGKIEARLRQFWTVPAWMDTGKLTAKVLVKVAPDGRVISKEFLKSSGNAEFDGYVVSTIERASPLPPPPDTLKHIALENGFEWGFPK